MTYATALHPTLSLRSAKPLMQAATDRRNSGGGGAPARTKFSYQLPAPPLSPADRYATSAWSGGGRAYETMTPSSNPNGGRGGGGIVPLARLPEDQQLEQQRQSSVEIRGAGNFLLTNQSALDSARGSSSSSTSAHNPHSLNSSSGQSRDRNMDTEALV